MKQKKQKKKKKKKKKKNKKEKKKKKNKNKNYKITYDCTTISKQAQKNQDTMDTLWSFSCCLMLTLVLEVIKERSTF